MIYTSTTEIYTLSLHDALPIFGIKSNISTNRNNLISGVDRCIHLNAMKKTTKSNQDRKSGSAGMPRPISYAVFCLKKKRRPPRRGGLAAVCRRPARERAHDRVF